MELLFFKPLLKSRIWGGQKLASHFNRTLPANEKIGESWEIVDRPEDQSIVTNGSFAGMSLKALLNQYGAKILGPNYKEGNPFPILIKWLDCKETLSVQVHPNPNKDQNLQDEPKTENWYVVDHEQDAKIYLGLREGVTKADFTQALDENSIPTLLNTIETNKGDSFLIKSGVVHAIGAGHLILEVQQNSDTTYRVYDWNRNGLDGKPRALHRNESLKSIDFNNPKVAPERLQGASLILADTEYFRITAYEKSPEDVPLQLPSHESARIIHVIEGCLENTSTQQTVQAGDNVLQAFVSETKLKAVTPTRFLITDKF